MLTDNLARRLIAIRGESGHASTGSPVAEQREYTTY